MVTLLALLGGCVSRSTTTTVAQRSDLDGRRPGPATTQPILYHRTGGIAGTDDRVVIWPDGVVEVRGKLLPPGVTRIGDDQLQRLANMFGGWPRLKDSYLDPSVADAYTITIHYGDKSVAASDAAPGVPPLFRRVFVEIESIAAQASNATMSSPPPPPTAP